VSSLPEPSTPDGAAGLAAILAEPARALVAMDYDGTLAPIVESPRAAYPEPGALTSLARLAAVVGVVVIVTGRPVDDVLNLSGLSEAADLQRLVILGQYGLERYELATGERRTPAPLPGVAVARERLPALLAAAGVPAEAVEDKGHALAVHTRGLPDPAGTLQRLRKPLVALAHSTGLTATPGRFVIELRPSGVDKGAALTELVRQHDAKAVLFAGDDVGDLPAYDTVAALRTTGVAGVTICSDSAEVGVLRERADLVVAGPAGVVALLEALAAAIGTG